MDLGIVVSQQLIFFFRGPFSQWFSKITRLVFGTDHEPDLARGVCGDSSVCITHAGENLFAVFDEPGDQWEMKPDVLACEIGLA